MVKLLVCGCGCGWAGPFYDEGEAWALFDEVDVERTPVFDDLPVGVLRAHISTAVIFVMAPEWLVS